MKTPKLVIVGYSFGLLVILAGGFRYFIEFNDLFKFLVVFAVGSLILLFSYLYSWMRQKNLEDKKQTDRLDAIVDFFMKRQEDSILDKARGIGNELD